MSDVELKSHFPLNFKTEEICNIEKPREQEMNCGVSAPRLSHRAERWCFC